MGELERARVRADDVLRQARERGNHFATAVLPVGPPNLAWLGADDPAEAERRIYEAVGPPFEEANYWYLYQGEYARVHIDLYRGDGLTALQRVERLWAALRRSWFVRLPVFQGVLHDLRAKCALQVAEHQGVAGERRDRLLEAASNDARAMGRSGLAWYAPYIDRTHGIVAAVRGDQPTALARLERSALGFEHLGMGLLAAAVRWRLGGLAQEAQRSAAKAWMITRGVAKPERMVPLC